MVLHVTFLFLWSNSGTLEMYSLMSIKSTLLVCYYKFISCLRQSGFKFLLIESMLPLRCGRLPDMSPPMQELFPFLECLISALTCEHQPSGMHKLLSLGSEASESQGSHRFPPHLSSLSYRSYFSAGICYV